MLVLVRHGETEANAAGVLLGRAESDLTARGYRQAQAIAAALAGDVAGCPPAAPLIAGDPPGHQPIPVGPCQVVRVVSSPLGRARQTAAVVAEACGVDQVEIDERWVELDYGDLDGAALDQVPAATWDRWRRDPDFVPAGGESLSALGRRVSAALVELAGEHGGTLRSPEHVVVVSHVSPTKAAVAWTLGVPDGVAWRLWLAPGSATVVGWSGTGPSLRAFNLRLGLPLPY
ncbi:MAG: histidine phosphatase family protein [Actinomycetota bacterium]|nr:histidine phosphatase family protein [Actinomycetota bacterium]